MTGRERFIRMFRGEEIDRVPVAPFIYNNFINEFFNSPDADPVEKGIEVYESLGFDIILRTCNVWDYLSECACDAKNWRVSETKEGEGKEWIVVTTVRTPEKELTQRKSYNQVTQNEVLEAVVEYYIKDESDFNQFLKYQPPVPEYNCESIIRARELLGDKGLAAPWAQGVFNIASFYRKLDDLILDPYINLAFYDRMMKYFSGRMYKTIKQFVKAGADIVCCGGNVGNATMVGPNHFRDFILSYEAEFTKEVKDLGVYYLYHNCGDAASLLDIYSRVGMDIYESLTPKPFGDTNLEDALVKIDKSITLCGNIDQIAFLKEAEPGEIRHEVKRVLDLAKKRGKFILGTTDYFSEGTPCKNIKAFSEAGREFGNY